MSLYIAKSVLFAFLDMFQSESSISRSIDRSVARPTCEWEAGRSIDWLPRMVTINPPHIHIHT